LQVEAPGGRERSASLLSKSQRSEGSGFGIVEAQIAEATSPNTLTMTLRSRPSLLQFDFCNLQLRCSIHRR
jgi:hypothetical protein